MASGVLSMQFSVSLPHITMVFGIEDSFALSFETWDILSLNKHNNNKNGVKMEIYIERFRQIIC